MARRVYRVALSATAKEDLRPMRRFEGNKIAHAIELNLTFEPTHPTRNRKKFDVEKGMLPFEHVLPIWELRVGEWRVYYDVDEIENIAHVRAVRRKLPHQTTEDSLK